ncbi:CsbD family protein [Paludisphaera mucosa]|uniref:CsbD family protein n=1 Tax=Paludisphaera mucosa TaxID=3030827 RepID=A0ABT6F4E2_9BACT|nr:CsbD family protein [Paludisphaera mucosa]MDG3002366.1 CsbD family protein [Paludisphaera mucosa]
MAANLQNLQGQWNQLKGDVKKKWAQLTDDDLRWTNGNVDQLIGRIQERTGEKREQIEKYFDTLMSEGSSMLSNAVENVGQAASQATNRLREGYSKLSDQAGEQLGHARELVGEQYGQARELVIRNPVQWVAAAFGVGFLAGIIAGYTSSAVSHQQQSRRFF